MPAPTPQSTTPSTPPTTPPAPGMCPAFSAAMSVLGKRWNGAIIQTLGAAPQRFGDIKRTVDGISDAVLTRRLAELQGCALIHKSADTTTGRDHYALTEKGAALLPALGALTTWAEEWAIVPHPASDPPEPDHDTPPIHPTTQTEEDPTT
ncbi:MAG TPA: helix-turn-helix transcriptional regulator [Pseudoclavibacter sp.]|nr:helix-turn-helix transcriptional regulator [Pseudoclavibacter sp.]